MRDSRKSGIPWPLQVVLVLLVIEIAVAFVYLLLIADVGEFPEGPPNRFGDALTYTVMMMGILFVPSVLGGILYAPILHGQTGRAPRSRALLLSPIALAGVWLIVSREVQTLDAVILTLIATVLFGLVVLLPRGYASVQPQEDSLPARDRSV